MNFLAKYFPRIHSYLLQRVAEKSLKGHYYLTDFNVQYEDRKYAEKKRA